MAFKQTLIIYILSFVLSPTLAAAVIAVDGASGFMGTSLIREFSGDDLHIGVSKALEKYKHKNNVYVGNISDPVYLTKFLKDVDVYYQMASITSVFPQDTLNQYILTNSIGPYFASRVNKDMCMLSLSSIAIYDVTQSAELQLWIEKFVQHYSAIEYSAGLSQADVQHDFDNFMAVNPPPNIPPKQYYGLSKLLLEKLLAESAKSRAGNIYLIRPALIVGEDIRNRSGDGVLKDLMNAIFVSHQNYEVWNRLVYCTPTHKIKAMMLFVTSPKNSFAKYEVFDAGWVPMQQHDFVNKMFIAIKSQPSNIKLVSYSGFDRIVVLHEDERVKQFYPQLEDVDQAIDEMVGKYMETL